MTQATALDVTQCRHNQKYLSLLGCYAVSNGKHFHNDNQCLHLQNQTIHEAQQCIRYIESAATLLWKFKILHRNYLWQLHYILLYLVHASASAAELDIYFLTLSSSNTYIFYEPTKGNILKCKAFCREKIGDCAACHNKCSKYIYWLNIRNTIIGLWQYLHPTSRMGAVYRIM